MREKSGKAAPPVRSPLIEEARRLRLKKSFSQNFLVDEGVLDKIVSTFEVQPGDQILEIGPGAGFLTRKLLETGAEVTAVELDRDMVWNLTGKWHDHPRFTLVEQDILKFSMLDYLASRPAGAPIKVLGNLPYNITSPILFYLLGELAAEAAPIRWQIPTIGVMVQKEVGQRITARPGSKAYNPLSIAVQYWYEARMVLDIPSRSFYPAPKVDSSMVKITPRTEPLCAIRDISRFDKLIRAAFSQRRKTLKNSLVGMGYCTAEALAAAVEAISSEFELDPLARAEALSIEQLGALSNALCADPR
jgi:16S rRNA (adenine1518-N6/adenine1519-N6)-dimethyltransferase